jgi:RNA polymerase sigma-70 factor (ECF subfamily)
MGEGNDRRGEPATDAAGSPASTIDATLLVRLYDAHVLELRRFVIGVTGNADVANDVLQATFAKAVEHGHTARSESLKGWLFRVAYHEALTARRRRDSREQGNRKLAALGTQASERPDERLIRGESVEAVRQALNLLPPEQRRVVLARIYEDKTFAEIATDAGLPLGTILTRMRLALGKLKRSLGPER